MGHTGRIQSQFHVHIIQNIMTFPVTGFQPAVIEHDYGPQPSGAQVEIDAVIIINVVVVFNPFRSRILFRILLCILFCFLRCLLFPFLFCILFCLLLLILIYFLFRILFRVWFFFKLRNSLHFLVQKIHLHILVKAYGDYGVLQCQLLDGSCFKTTGDNVQEMHLKAAFGNLQDQVPVRFLPD